MTEHFKVEWSISDYLRRLAETKDKLELAILRFQFELAQDILHEAQDNIRDTFGKTDGRSDLTLRSRGTSARRSGRGGGLRNSGQVVEVSGGVQVEFGGPGVPYAAIHETGGSITPRTAQFLTIPFQPKYAGTRAREHDLRYAVDAHWGPVLIVKGRGADEFGAYDESAIAFVLRKHVTIPARPYLKPAVDKVTRDAEVIEKMKKLLGRTDLPVEVS